MGEFNGSHNDRLAAELAGLNREQIKPKLLNFRSPTRLDFTEEFLDKLTTEQLRHVLLAALLYLGHE